MDYQDTSPFDRLLSVSKYLDSYVSTSFTLSYVDIVLLTRQYSYIFVLSTRQYSYIFVLFTRQKPPKQVERLKSTCNQMSNYHLLINLYTRKYTTREYTNY